MRLCVDQATSDEDVALESVEIYVQWTKHLLQLVSAWCMQKLSD